MDEVKALVYISSDACVTTKIQGIPDCSVKCAHQRMIPHSKGHTTFDIFKYINHDSNERTF